jgi:DNA-binding MarR family transcriptional regulator
VKEQGQVSERAEDQLDLGHYVPYFVRAIANRLSASATKLYKQEFGIGLSEWSCLAALAAEGETSAKRICEVSGSDKALISRSLASLESKALVAGRSSDEGGRRPLMRLTPEGVRVYLAISQLALSREERLLEGMSLDDRATLREILKTLHRNAIAIVDEDRRHKRPRRSGVQS